MRRLLGPLLRRAMLARLLVLNLAITVSAEDAASSPNGSFEQARGELYASYREKLFDLAERCEKLGLVAEADLCRRWYPARDAYKIYIFKPQQGFHEAAANDPEIRRQWAARLRTLRVGQGDALFQLAKRALAEHQPHVAYELVAEAAREDPEHAESLHILGRNEKDPAEPRSKPTGRGNWRVDTEHYTITSDHSVEAAEALGRKLEQLNQIWRQVFVTYYTSEAEMAKWFEGANVARSTSRRHQVVLFRDKAKYVEQLRPAQPQIERTLGIYFDTTRRAYFFVSEDEADATLYHEATHQLFQEMRPVAKEVGRKNNFWLIEAIACYMESLTEYDHYFTVGGLNEGRMVAARHRLLENDFYVPLAELTSYGMLELQRDQRLPMIYSQSAGLATFFMHGQGGKLRSPLVSYLQSVYTNRANPGTLSKLMEQSSEELDAGYRNFMAIGSSNSSPLGGLADEEELRLVP